MTAKRKRRPVRPECPVCFGDLPQDEVELALHRWGDFTESALKVISYARTYSPPEVIPDNYMPVRRAVEMIRELLSIAETWTKETPRG